MTNGDKWRERMANMTDEEIASGDFNCNHCPIDKKCGNGLKDDCYTIRLKWLKQEIGLNQKRTKNNLG